MLVDIHQAIRRLLKAPGFSALVIGILAVGIAATTVIFSVVDGVLLRPLPYKNASRLVAIVALATGEEDTASLPDLNDWSRQTTSFDAMAGYTMGPVTLTGQGEPVSLQSGITSADFFRMLDTPPLIGRTLTNPDDATGAAPVAVLSEATWTRYFDRRPSIVGQSIRLDSRLMTVVGVMPDTAQFGEPVDVWLPVRAVELLSNFVDERGAHFLNVIARLAPGIALNQANADLNLVSQRLAAAYPKSNAGRTARAASFGEKLVGEFRLLLLVLFGAVAVVLLIACGNVANLLLARGAGRQREMAIRAAVGAARSRLIRASLVESVLLASIAGSLGVALAQYGLSALVWASPVGIPRVHDVTVNARVLMFSTVLSVATGVLFGLVPSLQLSQVPAAALRDGAYGMTRRSTRTRQTLVVAEVALSVVLLVSAGLLIRSLVALGHVDPGFVTAQAYRVAVALPESRYPEDSDQRVIYKKLVDAVASVPGVLHGAAATTLPMSGDDIGIGYTIDSRPETAQEHASAMYFAISPDYFQAMGIRLLKGRTFTERDDERAPNVIVISETMAHRYWPAGDAIGKTMSVDYNQTGPREIVGVVADVKNTALTDRPAPSVYTPFLQTPWPVLSLVVRGAGSPIALERSLKAAVRRIDLDQLATITPVSTFVARTMATEQFVTTLIGGFAVFALLLAASGLFSVMAYSVVQRRREFGIRFACGARPGDVRGLILWQASRLGGIGLVLGLAGGLGAMRVFDALLFNVAPEDPMTLAGVCAALSGVLMLAACLPAYRASRVSPTAALRAD